MDTSPQLQRALILHQQGRHDMAEKELRQFLAATPENAFALAVLAISLAELRRRDEAEAAAREAIGHEPDLAFAHYALARVLTDRNRLDDASAAIREAVRLEPDDADYHGMNAAIELGKERWQAALDAAETGLQMDPEHVTCNNLRAMALVKLGRQNEAGNTIDNALSREPDNSFSHANKGWTLLEQGRRKEALAHFQESLRLEPGNEWAREGLVEALKAGNPIYAVALKYFLWMQKLSSGARWGIIVAGYFGNRLLGQIASSNPDWAPWIAPCAHPLHQLCAVDLARGARLQPFSVCSSSGPACTQWRGAATSHLRRPLLRHRLPLGAWRAEPGLQIAQPACRHDHGIAGHSCGSGLLLPRRLAKKDHGCDRDCFGTRRRRCRHDSWWLSSAAQIGPGGDGSYAVWCLLHRHLHFHVGCQFPFHSPAGTVAGGKLQTTTLNSLGMHQPIRIFAFNIYESMKV